MKMQPQYHSQDQLVQAEYDALWFETLFEALDQLHDAASVGQLRVVSQLAPAEMVGWLQDIIYTAQETIYEIQAGDLDNMKTVTGADLFS